MKLLVSVHGHTHQVSAALLNAELERSGPPPKLPLLTAILQHAPREQALPRLTRMLAHPVPAGSEPLFMTAALGLLGLCPALWPAPQAAPDPAGAAPRGDDPGPRAALAALDDFAARTGGAAGATLAAGVILLRDGPAGLCPPVASALLLRQSPRAIAELRDPGPLVPHLQPLCAAWITALDQAARTQGAHAFRGLLGDVAEALYRMLYRSRCRPEDLLTEDAKSTLVDTMAFELPGTADFLAARAMVWLLGALAPPDDAGVAAIERARDRFRNEAFHADCAAILSGQRWPPAPAGQ